MTIAASWSNGFIVVPRDPFAPIKRTANALRVAVWPSPNVWSKQVFPSWIDDTIARLDAVMELDPGWDGASAPCVAERAFEMTLKVLMDTMSTDTVAPQVVPVADGGLQLEWHSAGVDLEVYIDSDGTVSAWCKEGSREWEEDFYPRARLIKELNLLTSEYCR